MFFFINFVHNEYKVCIQQFMNCHYKEHNFVLTPESVGHCFDYIYNVMYTSVCSYLWITSNLRMGNVQVLSLCLEAVQEFQRRLSGNIQMRCLYRMAIVLVDINSRPIFSTTNITVNKRHAVM